MDLLDSWSALAPAAKVKSRVLHLSQFMASQTYRDQLDHTSLLGHVPNVQLRQYSPAFGRQHAAPKRP